jgi:pilus assembly protein CpaB
VYRYLREQQSQVEAGRLSAKGTTVDVVVAEKPIPVGTRIEAENLRLAKWPVELEPQGARAHRRSGLGQHRARLDREEPAAPAVDLVPKGAGLLPLLITDGMRGMSVRVDSVTGVSGFITPNSRVDVLVSGHVPNAEGGADGSEGKVILQNVRVLATGQEIEAEGREAGRAFRPSPCSSRRKDAEKLTVATRQEASAVGASQLSRRERSFRLRASRRERSSCPTRARRAASRHEGDARSRRPTVSGVQVLLGDKVTRQPLY